MLSEVKIRSADFMESQNENESLRSRIREVQDENEELTTQNLLQNRTIRDQRNELLLLRFQISELADTNALLRERVRTLIQNAQQQENEGGVGPVTAPPLMPPLPVPPPFPPRIRITSRQVGAGEALTPPLGISMSSSSRQRIKRNCRQGFYRSNRNPYRRLDSPEPGPSSQAPSFSSERPNFFVGLKIIPQFQSFVCSSSQLSSCNDSASDSSGSDESPQILRKSKSKYPDLESILKKPVSFSRDFELLRNVRNLHHQKVQQSVLQNYDLSLPNTSSRFFFPLSWDRKNGGNPAVPSTSGNEVRSFQMSNPSTSGISGLKNFTKISDCAQYTFPKIHEGLHHSGVNPIVTNDGRPSTLKKFKKNIPCSSFTVENSEEVKKEQENGAGTAFGNDANQKNTEAASGIDSESLHSFDGTRALRRTRLGEMPSDFEQDGFQADESSNCLTSTDNSLEKISLSEFNTKKKN